MRKLLILFLALVLVALSTGTVFAQEEGSSFAACGDLTEEECAPRLEAWAGMEALTTGANDSSIMLNVTNVPGLPMDAIDIQIDRSGNFEASPALVASFSELQQMDRAELMTMLEDPAQFDKLLGELIAGLDTAQKMDITLSPEIAQMVSEGAGINIPPELTVNFVIKDGNIYLNMADIAGLVPQLAMFGGGWVGFELKPLMDFVMQKLADADTPAGPELLQFVAPGIGLTGMISAMHAPLNKTALVERVEDLTVDGAAAAKYNVDLNFPGYMASPDFQGLLGPLARDYAEDKGVELNDENIGQIAGLVSLFSPVILGDLKYNIQEVIGLDDNVVHSTDGELEWDTSGLLDTIAALQDSEEPLLEAAPYIHMVTSTTYADHDSGTGVATPQAFVLPITMILSIIGG